MILRNVETESMNGLFPTPSNYLLHVCARALHHCALFALLLCAAARAAAPDSAPPIYLQADAWTYDDLKQVSVLTGHVVITQGAMVIRGERVILRQDPEGYQYMSSFAGNGARASFRQKREGVNEYIEGFAEQIDYDGKSDVTTLLRRAQVRRLLGRAQVLDEVRGNLIRYDAKQALYSARASADNTRPDSSGGRVRAMLSAPKEQAPMRRLSTP